VSFGRSVIISELWLPEVARAGNLLRIEMHSPTSARQPSYTLHSRVERAKKNPPQGRPGKVKS